MNKQKFRASFTVLNYWSKGQIDNAIKAYFKMDQYISREMAEGKNIHKEFELYINNNKKLPKEIGGKKLLKPQCEFKLVSELFDWCDLVGVIDCLDIQTIYEFKTGLSSSGAYIDTYQIGIYAVLLLLNDIKTTRGVVYSFNQYSKKYDVSMIYITDKLVKDSLNWIETNAGEMHTYLIDNDLYKKLKK